jgi:hypothetical protein
LLSNGVNEKGEIKITLDLIFSILKFISREAWKKIFWA